MQWIDYCYGADYQERTFDENLVPTGKVAVDTRKIKEQESLLDQKDAEIEALRKQIEQMSTRYTAEKEQHQKERTFQPEDLSEFKTRKIYIDVDLKLMGWKFTGPDADVQEEYRVEDMVKTACPWRWWKPSAPARTQTLDANKRFCMRIVWNGNLAAAP